LLFVRHPAACGGWTLEWWSGVWSVLPRLRQWGCLRV